MTSQIALVLISSIVPPCVWLYFSLKEDANHPEPKELIALTFVAGMCAVPLVLPLESFAKNHLHGQMNVFVAWALIEEVLKYGMAALFIFWRPEVDEAPDYVIYMITIALGFASAENILFLLEPYLRGEIMHGFLTTDIRFLGSTLLHVIASGAIGFALAFTSHLRADARVMAAGIGLILAIALHASFNLLIMTKGASSALVAFFFVWIAGVIGLAVFEVLKYSQNRYR